MLLKVHAKQNNIHSGQHNLLHRRFDGSHNQVPTLQSTRFLEDRRHKSRNIKKGLLNTPAMNNSECKEVNYLLRHLYTRVAAQGRHHWIFTTKGFHSPNKRCQCTLCGGLCNTYHIIESTKDIGTILLCRR